MHLLLKIESILTYDTADMDNF